MQIETRDLDCLQQIELWLGAMRPSLLDPFFAAITTLPGVGPKVEKLFRTLLGRDDIPRAVDLLFHLPTGTVDRRARPKLRDVVPGLGRDGRSDGRPPSPLAAEPSARAVPDLCQRRDRRPRHHLFPCPRGLSARSSFRSGEKRYVSGTTALYDGMLQMVHPDRVVDEKGLAALPMVEPVYPLTEGLGLNQVRKATDARLRQNSGAAGMAGRGLAVAQSLSFIRATPC